MNHKELTAHIRNRIKKSGISARVCMSPARNYPCIQVKTPKFDGQFTADEIETICIIAKVNGLTFVQGMEIDPIFCRQLTGKWIWEFYL